MINIKIIVDNRCVTSELKESNGLSIYLEHDNTYLLFDLGSSNKVFQHNVEATGIDLGIIDGVVISHEHSNHVGGIPYVGWESPFSTIYIPYGSMDSLGRVARSNSLKPVEVIDWVNPWKNIYISKPFHGPPYEHFLIINSERGLIVLSGCMHPGVDRVIPEVTRYFNKRVYCIIGGFHLFNAPENIVVKTINRLVEVYRVEKIIPLHCSGELFKNILKQHYPDKYIEAGCGSEITIE